MKKITDGICRFLFKDIPIKGSFVSLENQWHEVIKNKNYSDGVMRVIAEIITSNILLTTSIKLDGKIIFQLQENDNYKVITSEVNNHYEMRATASLYDANSDVAYSELLNSGRLVATVQSADNEIMYQSVVDLDGSNIASIFNSYMERSEQINSLFVLAYSPDKIAGFMIQQMPDSLSQVDDIDRIFMLTKTLKSEELLNDTIDSILYKLYNEDDIELYQSIDVKFKCNCGEARVLNILSSLGSEEIRSMINDGIDVVVDCDYCSSKYIVTIAQLYELHQKLELLDSPVISDEIN